MLFPRKGGNMLKNTKNIIFLHLFSDYSNGSYKI